MDTMKQDVHFALRQVRRTPMVSLFIVATLAVGIGVTAAIFSAVDTMLLRPIYPDEHELVQLNGAYKNRGDDWSVSLPNAADWASRSHSFSSVAWHQRVSMTLNEAGSPDRIGVITSTPSLFRVLDVTPLMGRLIADENARPDGERVVVLSHGFWQTRFAGDKAVIGKTIEMNGRPATIIGVMRPDFAFPASDVAAYMALRATPSTWPRSNGGLRQGTRLVVTGLAAGLVGAVLAARVMRSLLHGVSTTDPTALGLTVVVLVVVGALGSLLPALRASRIEPTEALRSQ